ncbi:MAG: hypothetical protein RLZZ380_56 [Actinomycetota bacterium]|jgi:membrane-anchored protein YejM (alkaline phosphatase superfamily)
MPTRKEIIIFWLTNDARSRSSERSVLTKKIMKTLKRENPERYWGFYGSIYGLMAIMLIVAYFMVQDAYGDVMPYAYSLIGLMFAAIPVIGYTGFKMFETYFNKYPEDFPRD